MVPKSRREDVSQRLKEAWSCEAFENAQDALDQLAADYQDKYPAAIRRFPVPIWPDWPYPTSISQIRGFSFRFC
ncbi:MAG: hypothetical protein JXR52_08525 [Bacteroidales bacterium]|nr:hypothetical protein [Bacteroidales bacterium]MBN2698856.1 hypothetical protein [Bacteroidales bacterium]